MHSSQTIDAWQNSIRRGRSWRPHRRPGEALNRVHVERRQQLLGRRQLGQQRVRRLAREARPYDARLGFN
jgi:hypothetical protein